MSICLKDTLNLAFDSTDCVQAPDQDITLQRVYRSQPYWNSGLVLPHYGCTIGTWADVQFHLYCEYSPTGQQFRLYWKKHFRPNSRECASDGYEWDFDGVSCDPLSISFSTENNPVIGEGCRAADDCFSTYDPSFIAVITE